MFNKIKFIDFLLIFNFIINIFLLEGYALSNDLFLESTANLKDSAWIDVRTYGASNSASPDINREALQAAIDATGAGGVYVDKSLILNVRPAVKGGYILTPKAGIKIFGGGTIKISDDAGPYMAIIGSPNNTIDYSGAGVDGIIFDHNIRNNPIADLDEINNYRRVTFQIFRGADCFFINNTVKNDSSKNTVCLNGDAVLRPVVRDNRFYLIGFNPKGVVHDHSTIYIHTGSTGQVFVQNNIFTSAPDGASHGARTAIETHGSRVICTGNQIYGYRGGFNITGINESDSQNLIISSNIIDVLRDGIQIWSSRYHTHTTGYGIDSCTISRNKIRIHQTDTIDPVYNMCRAIFINSTADLPMHGIYINNNEIEFDLQNTIGFSLVSTNYAIGYLSTKNVILSDCYITDNSIINSPMSAIRVSGNVTLSRLFIQRNRIINPSRSLDAVPDEYKIPIFIYPTNVLDIILIDGNNIIDTSDVTRMKYAILLGSENTSINKQIILKDNEYLLSGDKAAWKGPIRLSTSNILPHIFDRATTFGINPSQPVKAGSAILDLTTNYRHFVSVDGTIWNREGNATAPPESGVWSAGDKINNTAPTPGGYMGWVCTSGGSPGTWKGYGMLAQ